MLFVLSNIESWQLYEFRQMAISCKWMHISKLIKNQLYILYKLRCCWSIHCMKHLWMNWFIVGPRRQYWVMVEKNLYLNVYWIRWNFNNACNASFFLVHSFALQKLDVFSSYWGKYTIYSRITNLLWVRYEIMLSMSRKTKDINSFT